MSVQSLQRIALATRIKKVVVGGPGVGKSWAALQRLQALVCDKQVLPENILIAAPTYNRAHVLQAASDIVLPLGSMVKVHTPSTFVSFVTMDASRNEMSGCDFDGDFAYFFYSRTSNDVPDPLQVEGDSAKDLGLQILNIEENLALEKKSDL